MDTETQGTVGTNSESSIPAGMPGTVTLDWHASSNVENISGSTSLIYQFSPRRIPSLISPRTNSDSNSGSSPSTIPSLRGSFSSSPGSQIFFLGQSVTMNSSPAAQSTTLTSYQQLLSDRSRSRSRDNDSSVVWSPPVSPVMRRGRSRKFQKKRGKSEEEIQSARCHQLAMNARKENDAMVYLDGPRIYTCGECRTHLTSHDEIISKSFHGRHGRAYLFDMCVNVSVGPAEDRRLMTGLHSVCDISCKRCKTTIGWTYAKAYEPSQKYKEGKFIVEKIHLHMEESDYYQVNHPAGERRDRWKMRSMSWSEQAMSASEASSSRHDEDGDSSTVYEYRPRSRTSSSLTSWSSHSTPKSSAQLQASRERQLSPETVTDLSSLRPPHL